jgi:hypothetical protein
MDIEAAKFYIRYREDYPETEVIDYARRGMWSLNVETTPYYWIDDIETMNDLSPTVGVSGWIGDIHAALNKMGKPIPENIDYPDALQEFLGRKIWRGTLEEVRSSIQPLFVKPVEHKAFTGFVWHNDQESRSRVVTQHDNAPVIIAEPVQLVAEYRSFVLYHKVIDCRLYKGDWSKAPNRDIVESAVKKMGKKAPNAYCLDWGVLQDGRTVLVEMNEGYAFGHYGLNPISYARMLSARWFEMTK